VEYFNNRSLSPHTRPVVIRRANKAALSLCKDRNMGSGFTEFVTSFFIIWQAGSCPWVIVSVKRMLGTI
jgi:hypothetical protein